MADRQATLLVSDDFLVSLSGKFTILGIYTGDIGINNEVGITPQLVFLFVIECDLDDPFRSIILEISLPGERAARRFPYPILAQPQTSPGRTRWTLRIPIPITNVTLNAGQIKAKVIHDKGTIEIIGPWISLIQ
jgi:hypothetical protein